MQYAKQDGRLGKPCGLHDCPAKLGCALPRFPVLAGNRDEATRQVERWDLLTRKLQVGVFLRTGSMDVEAGRATEDLRERLEELRDALLADDLAGSDFTG